MHKIPQDTGKIPQRISRDLTTVGPKGPEDPLVLSVSTGILRYLAQLSWGFMGFTGATEDGQDFVGGPGPAGWVGDWSVWAASPAVRSKLSGYLASDPLWSMPSLAVWAVI